MHTAVAYTCRLCGPDDQAMAGSKKGAQNTLTGRKVQVDGFGWEASLQSRAFD